MNKLFKHLKKPIPFILWSLLVLLSLIIGFHFFSFSNFSHDLFAKRVQRTIYQIDDQLQKREVDFIHAIQQPTTSEPLLLNDFDNVTSEGLVVFRNDTLVYWNSNLVEPRVLRKRVALSSDTLINVSSGDFLVSSGVSGQYVYYLFSLINTTYPIENEFFVNEFQHVFGRHRVDFQPEEKFNTYPIYTKEGHLLSYLSIDFPSFWGSYNLPLLLICLMLMVLCATLLITRGIVAKTGGKTMAERLSNHKPWIPVCLYLLLVLLAIPCFRWLFRYGFESGFILPSNLRMGFACFYLFLGLLALAIGIILLNRWSGRRHSLVGLLGQIVLWSLLLTLLYGLSYKSYENRKIKQLALDLSEERDPDFERSYQRFLTMAQQDTTFFTTVLSDDIMDEVAEDYMRSFLFDSVMNQYDVELTLCTPGQELDVQPYHIVADCQQYFIEKVDANNGIDLGDGLAFMDYNTLDPSYLSIINVVETDTIPNRSLYFEFSKPIAPQGFGLPKILQNVATKLPSDYSVACYQDSLLIYKYGSYVYPNYLSDYRHNKNDFSYGRKQKHYNYQASPSKVIAISLHRRGWMETTAPFVVFFLALLVLFLLLYFVGGLSSGKPTLRTLSYKFQITLLITLGLSFLFVGPVSVFYLSRLYQQKAEDYHFERTRTLLLDITGEVDFSFLKQPGFKNMLDDILRHYSETFFTDINIYGLDGKMLATTSPEILDLHLLSSLMNAEAYHSMRDDKMLYFLHDEQLGKAVYQSAYIAIQDNEGNTLAYLNTPYFAGSSELRSEIRNYVLTYVNIILLIIFLSVLIVLWITRNVTKPLTTLQEKVKQLDITKRNEQLEWNSKDEIGALITEYNKKAVELQKSAEELRRNAMESAWRGVARQVAHEIHNSLTPMRLSAQMLEQAADRHSDDLEGKIKRTTGTLIEQIDALSDIASSFSNYAKLPENNPQPLNLAELVGNVVNLYNNADNITFVYRYDPSKDHTFNGDKTHLNSAVSNLIKNATQAIGNKPQGRVEVTLESLESTFVIRVKDNGKGIKEEDKKMIFLPNFTTKSGGSGVGLSLTHNIIQAAGGIISFESQEGEGAEFIIELPKN